MKKIVKIFMIVSLVKGYYAYGMYEGLGRESMPKSEPVAETTHVSDKKSWWSSISDRITKKTTDLPQPKAKQEPVSTKSSSKDSSSQTGVDFSQGPDAQQSTSNSSQKPSNPSVVTGTSADQFNDQDFSGGADEKSSGKKSKKHAKKPAVSDDSQGESLDEEVEQANQEFTVMNKTKDSLFDEFRLLKSSNGILSFTKLSVQDIAVRVKKSVDDISAKVGFSPDQELSLQTIMQDNLLQIQRKLKNKLIAQTPEEVARALFSGAEHDDRWADFGFKDVQQRDRFEDYVMNRAESMQNSSLLEDYLRVCSSMAKKAETAAQDAREIGEFSESSIINKLKVGVHRTRAGFYMAANPCILAVFTLGVVGEFIYGLV